jgi:N-acetyl sugar amidotransferase
MNTDNYRICTRCIMDTSDPDITFQDNGECNHCYTYDNEILPYWPQGEVAQKELERNLEIIRQNGVGKEYDCIIGLSGGVDSSYLAMKVKEWGLRALAVHVDAGWNSELASQNIENIVKKLGFDLHTHVVDWREMKDLHRAFLKSQVANQDTPQDHAFFAALYNFAVKNNIQYVLSGSNYATESILPKVCGYDAMDLRQLEHIHRKFGEVKLRTYPKVSFFKRHIYYPHIKGMKVFRPLNLMPYDKQAAINELSEKLDWKYYGGKHHESRFTKYFQAYYLTKKIGFDKRRAHLTSEVLSGLKTRDEALVEMSKPAYIEEDRQYDEAYLIKKLGFTEKEFKEIFEAPAKSHKEYPSNEIIYVLYRQFRKLLSSIKK